MSNTTAKIIADSISEAGIRITTLELEYLRFIHSQLMTHRQFSRSAQSSRAVPVSKLIENAKKSENPHFMKNQAGMQSFEQFEKWELYYANQYWDAAKDYQITQAELLLDLGVHKQFANRLLEPFTTIKVVVTATEWQNFFELRLDHAAQPEMQELAQAMKTAMNESTPNLLKAGEWHLPYVSIEEQKAEGIEISKKLSTARCARVSYLNHDNSNPLTSRDIELFSTLVAENPKHASPAEHQATPMECPTLDYYGEQFRNLFVEDGITHIDKNRNYWSGNFRGFIQHRQILG